MFDFGSSDVLRHGSSPPLGAPSSAASASLFNFSPRRVAVPVLVRDGIPCNHQQNSQHQYNRHYYQQQTQGRVGGSSGDPMPVHLLSYQPHPGGYGSSLPTGASNDIRQSSYPSAATTFLGVPYSGDVTSVYPSAVFNSAAVSGRYSHHRHQQLTGSRGGFGSSPSGFSSAVTQPVGSVGVNSTAGFRNGGLGYSGNAALHQSIGHAVDKSYPVGFGAYGTTNGGSESGAASTLTAAAAAAAIYGELNSMGGPPRWW